MADKPAVKTTFVAGAGIGTLAVWLIGKYLVPLPPEAAAAIAGLIGGIGGPLYRKLQEWIS